MRYCDYKHKVEQFLDAILNDCMTYNDVMESLADFMDDAGYIMVYNDMTGRDELTRP